MKVIIAGSRSVVDMQHINDAVSASKFLISEVVCGMARGADLLGREWAEAVGIPVAKFPADWDKHGKRAGYLRNEEMGNYAEALVAVWDGSSRGTASMVDIAHAKGLKVYVHIVKSETDELSGVVACDIDGANKFGCQPCPRCGNSDRYIHCDLRQHITCDKCKFTEPITREVF